ncbi:MAG: hypothetical protein ACI8Y4_005212 [Candidatus Poriferisodalaceae bacterium]|jgi:hypothetical protein
MACRGAGSRNSSPGIASNKVIAERNTNGHDRTHRRVAANPHCRPPVAIGQGHRSPLALERLADLYKVLGDVWAESAITELEVWLLDSSGDIERVWYPGREPVPESSTVPRRSAVRSTDTFSGSARLAPAEWKQTTSVIPEPARIAAPIGAPVSRWRSVCRPSMRPITFSPKHARRRSNDSRGRDPMAPRARRWTI